MGKLGGVCTSVEEWGECGGGSDNRGNWERVAGTCTPVVMTVSIRLELAYFVRLYLRSEARYEIMWKSCDTSMWWWDGSM